MLKITDVADLLAQGLKQSEIALITGYSVSTVSRLRNKLRLEYFEKHPEYANLRRFKSPDVLPTAGPSQWNLHEIKKLNAKHDWSRFIGHSGDTTVTFRADQDAKEILGIFVKMQHKSVNQFCREAVFEKLQESLQERKK